MRQGVLSMKRGGRPIRSFGFFLLEGLPKWLLTSMSAYLPKKRQAWVLTFGFLERKKSWQQNMWDSKNALFLSCIKKLKKEKDRKSENKNNEGNLKKSLGRYGWQASIKVYIERDRIKQGKDCVNFCCTRTPYLILLFFSLPLPYKCFWRWPYIVFWFFFLLLTHYDFRIQWEDVMREFLSKYTGRYGIYECQ